MSVKGKTYPYLGPGRELFPLYRAGEMYPAQQYIWSLWCDDPSTTWGTPTFIKGATDFLVDFDIYGATLTWSLAPPWPPDSFNSQLDVKIFFDTADGKWKVEIYVTSIAFVGPGPIAIPWQWHGVTELDPVDWFSNFIVGPAEFFQSGIKIADGFFALGMVSVDY